MMYKHNSGFTLIELMVAILILGIFVGIGIPGIMNMLDQSRTVSTTNSILGGIQYARSAAVEGNLATTWSLDNTSWTVTDENNVVLMTGTTGFSLTIDDVEFTALGYLDSTSEACIEITSPQGRERFIEILRSGQTERVNDCD